MKARIKPAKHGDGWGICHIKTWLLLCFCGYLCPSAAQYGQFDIERVSSKYGQPNGVIYQFLEDRYGFLWIGTGDGIFRFDGYEFKAYRHDAQDSTALSHPKAYTILEDHAGEIWAGTTYGLNLLDRRTGTFKTILPFPKEGRKSKSSNLVRVIFEDSRQNLWLICKWNLLRYDREQGQFFIVNQKGDPTAKHFVKTIYEDKSGTIWAGAGKGLLKLAPGDTAFQYILPLPNEPESKYNSEIKTIYKASDGSFWLGTAGGLINWDSRTNKVKSDLLPPPFSHLEINCLIPDRQGNLWMAFEQNGVGVYNTNRQTFNHYSYNAERHNSLNNNAVNCLFEDSFQNIWVGTENGVSKIIQYDSGYKLLQNEWGYDRMSNNIQRVFQDSKGGIWSKSPEGIFYIEKEGAKAVKILELEAAKKDVTRGWFLEDGEGGIWHSVSGEGIFRRGPNDPYFSKLPTSEMLSKNGINRIMIDNKDPEIVWIGSIEGLCRLNWKTMEERWYRPKNDVPKVSSDQVVIFEQYGNDEIWLYYTYSNALGRFDKNTGKFELILPPPDKRNALEGDMRDIVIGEDGNVWLANLFGLTRFNVHKREFDLYGKKEGLLENALSIALIDKNQQLWVCSSRFFARFDNRKKTFINYPISKEVRHFNIRSKYLTEAGRILFGSINGVYSFHPEKININQKEPKLILTDFKVKNESYLLDSAYENTTDIILSHDENDVSFSFVGLHFINPEANKYKCKLSSLDQQWRDLGHEHKISYTNLAPGEYTFMVIAANSDGVWNNDGLKIRLVITPAFWQTLWFKSLIVLMLVSIGYALFKNRQHQLLLRRQKELAEQSEAYKTRFLADVSHEIRTPMNAIIGLSKLALGTQLDEKQTKFINAIQQSSQNLLSIINDLLDHSKLEAGKFTFVNKPFNISDITDLINNTLYFKATEKGLVFFINKDENIPDQLIGDPIRLMQILTNLLGNAIKFTNEGNIWLNIWQVNNKNDVVKLKFEVGDSGIGIAQDQLETIFEGFSQANTDNAPMTEGTGLGLSISRQLVERQGGQLFIESELGKGTRLWFELDFGISTNGEVYKKLGHPQIKLKGLKILVAEDNEFNQMLMVEILEKHISSPEIEVAENGQTALEILNKQPFDIIILDVKMPIMDGYETANKIRQSNDGKIRKMPILGVTANAIPAQLEQCISSGMNDYVTKPVNEIELLEKIAALTKKEQLIDRIKLKSLLANDEKKVEKYLTMFKTQSPELIAQIKNGVSDGNTAQVCIAAHTLKSQCRFLGLEEIAELSSSIEQISSDGKLSGQLPILIEQLDKKIRLVIEKELA